SRFASRMTLLVAPPVSNLIRATGVAKHMTKRMTWESRSHRQRYRMRGEIAEEALGRRDQELHAASKAIRGDLVLHQPPDALGWVIVVAGVFGEPEDVDARMGDEPRRDDLG